MSSEDKKISEVLNFIFVDIDEDMKNWWIATFDEIRDILPENLKSVKSEDVLNKLSLIVGK
jgi:hypothetical protein